jgi:hypothetical protein
MLTAILPVRSHAMPIAQVTETTPIDDMAATV